MNNEVRVNGNGGCGFLLSVRGWGWKAGRMPSLEGENRQSFPFEQILRFIFNFAPLFRPFSAAEGGWFALFASFLNVLSESVASGLGRPFPIVAISNSL